MKIDVGASVKRCGGAASEAVLLPATVHPDDVRLGSKNAMESARLTADLHWTRFQV